MSRADELAAAAEHFETHDFSEEMRTGGTWVEPERGFDPEVELAGRMGAYSVRLPLPVLNALRERAAAAGVSTGALMRSWLEDRLAAGDPDDNERIVQTVRELAPTLTALSALAGGQGRPTGGGAVTPKAIRTAAATSGRRAPSRDH